MGFIFPVHPDDNEQLLRIRRYLIGFRKTNGWTRSELSKIISEDEDCVRTLETEQGWGWRFSRLQVWPEAFGLRLQARLMTSHSTMDAQIHNDPEVAPLHALCQHASGDRKVWQRAYLSAALRKARQLKGISGPQMGKLMGLSASAVTSWERGADQIMLTKVLHYARCLDGFVRLELGDK